MASLQEQKQQLQQKQQSLNKYQDPKLTANIRADIAEAYKPVLESSTDATRRMMGDFNVRYGNIPYMGGAAGTGAEDLTPQQKMEVMNRELGTMGGRLASASGLTEALGGSLNTMQQNALQDLQRAQQAAQQSYQQQFDQYRLAWEADQKRKDRELRARLAAASRPQTNIEPFDPYSKAPVAVWTALQSKNPEQLYQAMKAWEQQSGGYDKNIHEPGWYAWREMTYGPGAGAAGQDAIDARNSQGRVAKPMDKYIN